MWAGVTQHGINNTEQPQSAPKGAARWPLVNPAAAYWDIDLFLIYFIQDLDGKFFSSGPAET